jgi:hypothetical protein
MTAIETPGVAERGWGARVGRLCTLPAFAVAGVMAALGARFFLVISQYSVNVFFYDQWDFLTPFFRHQPGIAELFFWQHGPHREGIGLIADRFLYPLTHWNARTDSFLIGGSIFAAMLLALLLKRKLYGPLSYSDLAIPLIFLTLQQYEAVVSTPNPGYSGFPLLMMMLYCVALLGRNRWLRYSLVLALNFLLIYTGFGFFMGVVTVGVFLLECYWSWCQMTSVPFPQALTGLLVAVASVASFFVHYTFSPAADCFQVPRSHLLQYPGFMALMFSAFVVPRHPSVSWGMMLLGAAILLGMAAVLGWHLLHLRRCAGPDPHLIGGVLLGYSLLFSANAAIGRLCLGLRGAYTSRYVTLLIPAFLALYFYLLSKPWRGKRNLVLAIWILLLLPSAMHKPRFEMRWFSDGKRAWANCYVRTENIRYCDQSTNFAVYPLPPEQTGLQQKLDYLKQHRLNLFYEPSPKCK